MTMTVEDLILNNKDTCDLRHAIALVHCLQRERGASSVILASTPSIRLQRKSQRARKMTDRAFRPLSVLSKERQSLARIRTVVDEFDEETKPSFHRILALYNTLIQSILHLLVFKFTKQNLTIQDSNEAIKRSGSHSALSDLHTTQRRNLEPSRGHRRLASGGGFLRPTSDPETSLRGVAFTLPDPPEHLPTVIIGDDDESNGSLIENASLYGENQAATMLTRLLSMLDTFVKLKESIGMERATLSCIFLADEVDHRLMLNDVVLQVAAQKRHLSNLSVLAAGDMHDLVQELVALSPKMQQFHQKIIERYDIRTLKLDFSSHRELWNILTLYMDKLHALELSCLEEIAFWLEDEVYRDSYSSVRESIESILGLPKSCSRAELRDLIASRSDESLKNQLLDALAAIPCLASRGSSALSLKLNEATSSDKLKLDEATAKEWEIGIYEIEFARRIGEGAAGTTYLASWSGLDVAVKVASISDLGLEGWQTEVQALQKLHHPNIIRLLGCVHRENPTTFCLVLEYCALGDLHMVLHQKTPPNFFFTVAQDVAKGMSYLHKRGIMHRDIKPSNILLDGKLEAGGFSVKLTDFGMALELSLVGDRTAETGTYRWMAP